MDNFLDFGPCDLGKRQIMVYLDTEEYLGAGPLGKHQVHVKYQSDMVRDEEEYRLVVLKVLKKDLDRFREAMEELKAKMLICGHRDYETHGAELISEVKKLIREEASETGRISLPTGGKVRATLLPELMSAG